MSIFSVSFLAVFKLVIVILIGVWLGRSGILNKQAREALSKVIIKVMLPSLLIVSLSQNAGIDNLGKWSFLLIAAALFALFGFIIGCLLNRLFRVPTGLRRLVSVATSLGNASYLPMPLLATIAAGAPLFAHDPGAESRSIAYISVYLICHSPLLWLFGYPLLSGKSWREISWRMIANPPLFASGIGLLLAVVPPLNRLIVQPDAPLRVLLDAGQLMSAGVFPCALLILGANLAEKLPAGETVPWNAYAALVLGRLVLMPIIGYAFTLLAWRQGWIPDDPMFALVLMIEASVPPANNLMLMCQMHKRGEAAIARLLLCAYCLAVPSLTIAVTVFLKAVGGN